MTHQYAVFDVETGPLPLEQIQHLKPEFRAPANYKNPDAIKANLLEQEAKWLAEGALSALTGEILCVGIHQDGAFAFTADGQTEPQIVSDLLNWMQVQIQMGHNLVGFCSRSFDVPFIIRRAFRHGLQVPQCFWEGRYLSSQFVDIAERWACGSREPRDRISLDSLSKFLGTGQKNGDGADFAQLWASDRPKALAYLKNDLELTRKAYERLYACP